MIQIKYSSCLRMIANKGNSNPQLYIQLVNRPHFSVWAVWAVRVVRKKKEDLRNSDQRLSVIFSTFCGQKNNLELFKKYFSIRI